MTLGLSDLKKLTRELLVRANAMHQLPVDLAALAHCQGVELRESRQITDEGCLSLWPEPTIEYRRGLYPKRERHVVAHELAHTFFCPIPSRSVAGPSEPMTEEDEERLCNEAVPLLLLPDEAFGAALGEVEPSSRAVRELAERAGVAQGVVFSRLTHERYHWPIARVWWSHVRTETSGDGFVLTGLSLAGGMTVRGVRKGLRLNESALGLTYRDGRASQFCFGSYLFENSRVRSFNGVQVYSVVTYAR